jgi:hypothetical protein
MLGVGLLIGVITLPWSNKPSTATETPILWLALWACFWPLLLLFSAREGLKAYRKAWWSYSDRKQMLKHRAQGNQDDAFPNFPAHETVRDTFFKRRQ